MKTVHLHAQTIGELQLEACTLSLNYHWLSSQGQFRVLGCITGSYGRSHKKDVSSKKPKFENGAMYGIQRSWYLSHMYCGQGRKPCSTPCPGWTGCPARCPWSWAPGQGAL
uniref:Uncharacterized protein n=1 Tax=Hordeum vulgare subsp. vulgare TaxID=112509 RepID=A0A8I6YFH3_HORVV